MGTEESELHIFIEESKTAIQTAQSLGYLSAEGVTGGVFEVLNEVAERAFEAEDTEDVVALRERLHRIRDLSERVHLPFFGVEVTTNEDNSVGLILAD